MPHVVSRAFNLRRSHVRRGLAVVVSTAVAAGLLTVGAASGATAATPPRTSGAAAVAAPAPPTADGPHRVQTLNAPGFNGAYGESKIWYPADATDPAPLVALIPGFVSPLAWVEWLGPRLASHGFVVIGAQSVSPIDSPDARKKRLLAALDYALADQRLAGRIDPSRQAVAGWSMGGGGAMLAGVERPDLTAVVALAPWSLERPFDRLRVPTQIVTVESDNLAPGEIFGDAFYPSIPAEKMNTRLEGADHFWILREQQRTSLLVVSWLKIFTAGDASYAQYLCPGPRVPSKDFERYVATCPLG